MGDADRQLVELVRNRFHPFKLYRVKPQLMQRLSEFYLFTVIQQAVVEEPQNLTTPVTVVGEKGEIAAMLSAYIQTTGDMTSTHQIIIDSSDRSVKMFQQQRLPSLSSLPPMKKVYF